MDFFSSVPSANTLSRPVTVSLPFPPPLQSPKARDAHSDSPCAGCPSAFPSPGNPNPEQVSVNGQPLRYRLSTNCSTAFFDPQTGECKCTGSDCAFADISRAIGVSSSSSFLADTEERQTDQVLSFISPTGRT